MLELFCLNKTFRLSTEFEFRINFEYAISHAAALIVSLGRAKCCALFDTPTLLAPPVLCQFDTSFRIDYTPRDSCIYLKEIHLSDSKKEKYLLSNFFMVSGNNNNWFPSSPIGGGTKKKVISLKLGDG